MQKQPRKKITLYKETLRMLALRQLAEAGGGRFFDTHTSPDDSCRATICC